jgi:hypothetical protein
MPPPIVTPSIDARNRTSVGNLAHVYAAQMIACSIIQPALARSENGLLFAHAVLYHGLLYRITGKGIIRKPFWDSEEEALFSKSWVYISRYGTDRAMELIKSPHFVRVIDGSNVELMWIHRIVKYLLRLHLSDPSQASVSRAQFLARQTYRSPTDAWSPDRIRKSWVKYRNVSHLVYASIESNVNPTDLIRQRLTRPTQLSTGVIGKIVASAKDCVQAFGLLKPEGAGRRGIMKLEDMWNPGSLPSMVLEKLKQEMEDEDHLTQLLHLSQSEADLLKRYSASERRGAALF